MFTTRITKCETHYMFLQPRCGLKTGSLSKYKHIYRKGNIKDIKGGETTRKMQSGSCYGKTSQDYNIIPTDLDIMVRPLVKYPGPHKGNCPSLQVFFYPRRAKRSQVALNRRGQQNKKPEKKKGASNSGPEAVQEPGQWKPSTEPFPKV